MTTLALLALGGPTRAQATNPGSWTVTDPHGNPAPQSYDGSYPLSGPVTITTALTGTYQQMQIDDADWYCFSPTASSASSALVTGLSLDAEAPDGGLDLTKPGWGWQSLYNGSSIGGSVSARADSTASATLTYQSPPGNTSPLPDHVDLLLTTTVSASASEYYEDLSGLMEEQWEGVLPPDFVLPTATLSSSVTATDTLGDQVSASASSQDAAWDSDNENFDSGANNQVISRHLVRVPLVNGGGTVSVGGHAAATASNDSSQMYAYDLQGYGYSGANAGADITTTAQFISADLQAHSTVDNCPPAYPNNPPWDGGHPRFFSGTNCSATANAVALSGYVAQAQLLIGGTTVKQYFDTTAAPSPLPSGAVTGTNQTSVALSVHFDSTHFSDGSPIPIKMLVTDTAGTSYDSTISGPAVNNAYLLYNSGDPNVSGQAQAAATAVANDLAPSNIHATPDGGENVQGVQNKLGNSTSQYTVFFVAGHTANPGSNLNAYELGDSSATPLNEATDWLTEAQVQSAVSAAAASPNQPPYNFVYIHGCDSGDATNFINDFNISQSATDRGGIGFIPALAANQQNTNFTNNVWVLLAAGNTLNSAVMQATANHQPQAPDGSNASAEPYGDGNMTLSGKVYQGTTWFR